MKNVRGVLLILVASIITQQIAIAQNWQVAVNYPVGARPCAVFSADYDGDGDEDLAVTNYGLGNVGILMNNGGGTFAPAADYYVGDNTHSVFSADFDGDGDLDLAVSHYNPSSCEGAIAVLLNNGDGTFAPPVDYAAGDGPQKVFAADVNGNGSPDLAAANACSDDVSVLINNGDGTFAPPVNYPVGNYTVSVIAADFDGDGCFDLAVVGFWTYDVSILMGNCDGAFGAPVSYSVGALPTSVFAADLDNDGDFDLAVTEGGPDNVSVLWNNGDGIFDLTDTYPVGAGPRSVVTADFDGDSFPDLAVTNQNSDDVSFLMNNGDGSFALAFSLPVGDQPFFSSSADFDSNGFPDLAVPNAGSNTVSILLNNSSAGLIVTLDIKPGSCPNPLNVKSNGHSYGAKTAPGDEEDMAIGNPSAWLYGRSGAVLPVAILGTEDLDVASIDVTTIVLEGVAPLRWSYEDVATPMAEGADECECHDLGPDQFEDLTLKFNRGDIIAALGDVSDGDVIPLTISGELIDGTPFEGVDCVVIRGDLSLASNQTDGPDTMPNLNLVNSPNPFNPTTEISFSLAKAGTVVLEIYNIAGQRVATLLDRQLDAGQHACSWDASKVASGIYFYRLETDDFSASQKMLLLK